MNNNELFLDYLENENVIDKYSIKFENANLSSIKHKFYEKAEIQNSPGRLKDKKNRRTKFSIWIAATLVICLLTGAIAFGLIDMSPLISLIGEKFGTVLQPIGMVDEYDGIEVKTLAAINDNDMIYIYFTMRDLKADRIDSSIDIYDFLVTKTIGMNTEVISFDESTKTATLRMTGFGGENLNNKKISMIINSFLTGARKEEYNTRLCLAEILSDMPYAKTEHISKKDITGGSGEEIRTITDNGQEIILLKRDELNLEIQGLEWMTISNIGFVDDKLHIQINPDSNMGRFNHGDFFFKNEKDESVYYDYNKISFGEYKLENTIYGGDYIEYIFDISDIKELEKLKLMGTFTVYDKYTTGKWENQFTVSAIGESREIVTDIALNKTIIKKITLSPLGVNFIAQGKLDDEIGEQLPMLDFNITLHYENGEYKGPYNVMYYAEPGEYNVKYVSSELIDVDKVTSISINGETVNITN